LTLWFVCSHYIYNVTCFLVFLNVLGKIRGVALRSRRCSDASLKPFIRGAPFLIIISLVCNLLLTRCSRRVNECPLCPTSLLYI
jgi:hypothetical protein